MLFDFPTVLLCQLHVISRTLCALTHLWYSLSRKNWVLIPYLYQWPHFLFIVIRTNGGNRRETHNTILLQIITVPFETIIYNTLQSIILCNINRLNSSWDKKFKGGIEVYLVKTYSVCTNEPFPTCVYIYKVTIVCGFHVVCALSAAWLLLCMCISSEIRKKREVPLLSNPIINV